MPKKNRKYTCPPRRATVRCPICYANVSENGFYQHIATHK